jgi:shikimate dehydrogenase
MKLFTIFGNPVHHSKSPIIHNSVFYKFGLNYRYTRTFLEDGSKIREKFFELGLDGANVTVPHKEIAYEICDEVVGIAKKIKAVNTIIRKGSKLIGYNTDAQGFMDSIRDFENVKKVLILGAGGTAKALTHIMLENNIKVTIINRSENRLEKFKDLNVEAYTWEDFKVSKVDLVVNTTSAGLVDDTYPVLKFDSIEEILKNSRYAVDVIYKRTPFLRVAESLNLITRDGGQMLIGQGVLANQLFTNFEISKNQITETMLPSFYL